MEIEEGQELSPRKLTFEAEQKKTEKEKPVKLEGEQESVVS